MKFFILMAKYLVIILFFVALIVPVYFTELLSADTHPDTTNSIELVAINKGATSQNKIAVKKIAKVKPIIEKPLHNVDLPDFAKIRDISEKKKQFFDFIKPAVERANQNILAKRANVIALAEKVENNQELLPQERQYLTELADNYKVDLSTGEYTEPASLIEALLVRVDIIPKSIVLVQAANESAWGTSRFARIGLNFFGIWCYRPTCGMVPSGRNTGAKHEVAAFQSVDAAVKRYLYNINTHWAYEGLRAKRAEIRDRGEPLVAEELVLGLMSYSERGQDYIDEITDMLRHNSKYLN